MAIKGVSIPVLAKYTNTNGTVTYSEGRKVGHAIEYSVELETADTNNLYGDNMIVESDNQTFGGGTLTLNTAELTEENIQWLFGLTSRTEGTGAAAITIYSFDDAAVPLTIGFGIIEMHQVNNVDMFRAVILNKCRPRTPGDSAVTKGETVDWQTPEIEFDIMRSDATGHKWKEFADFATEAAAEEWLETQLSVSAG